MRQVVSVLVLLLAGSAAAQPTAAAAPCSFDRCAIRVEPGFFGTDIVAGPVGNARRVGRVGVVFSDLPELVADVPEALAFAEQRERRRVQSTALLLAGTALAILGPAARISSDGDDGAGVTLSLGSLAFLTGGAILALDADRAQARAVWAYNRSLAD